MKKISVVTVTYNCEKVIEETIRSVVKQKYTNFEYIIIDGASYDNTLEIINKYKQNIAVIYSEPDKGIFDAMNKSLDYVSGEYIIYLNAGDKFVDENVLCNVFLAYSGDDDLIYGNEYLQNDLGFLLVKADAIYSHNPSKRDLVFKSQGICHQCLFSKTEILRTTKFDLNFPIGADYDTTAKIYYKGNHKIKKVDLCIAIFDDRVGGASHNKELTMFKERFKMFNYSPSFFDWLLVYQKYIINQLKKKIKEVFPNLLLERRSKKYIKEV